MRLKIDINETLRRASVLQAYFPFNVIIHHRIISDLQSRLFLWREQMLLHNLSIGQIPEVRNDVFQKPGYHKVQVQNSLGLFVKPNQQFLLGCLPEFLPCLIQRHAHTPFNKYCIGFLLPDPP